ncbi:MAG: hypothetical protein Q8N98_00905 [bacterium]|nr:hypothetical protein [bacterium]
MQNFITLAGIRDMVDGRGGKKEAPRVSDNLRPIAIPWTTDGGGGEATRAREEYRLRPLSVTYGGDDGQIEAIFEVCRGSQNTRGRLVISGPDDIEIFQTTEAGCLQKDRRFVRFWSSYRDDRSVLVIERGGDIAFLLEARSVTGVLIVPHGKDDDVITGYAGPREYWEIKIAAERDVPGFVATAQSHVPLLKSR